MSYEIIADHQGEYPVETMCGALGVAVSGYYAWRTRPPSRREQENIMLREAIYGLWEQYHGIYGAPRIGAEIGRAHV